MAQPLTEAELAAAIEAIATFEHEPFVAVAVSGGPDSLALAILADRWARRRGGTICALSVDHGLRLESGAELRVLHGWLAARAIRHVVLAWEGEKPETGVQERARAARYRLLAGWCRENGCLHLLTAHHRDDQIETHLIRARAGSAADGLGGMSAVRELDNCRLLRPLLGVAKARLAALLEAERQPFIDDPSNCNLAFERARLRADGRATSDERLASEIRRLGRERAGAERARDALAARAVMLHPAGFAAIDPVLLRAAPRRIAEPLPSAVARTIGGDDGYPPRRDRVARLFDRLAAADFRGCTFAGCRFVSWRGRVLVMREAAAAEAPARLPPGGAVRWDRRFRATLSSAAAEPTVIGSLGQAQAAGIDCRAARRGRRLPRLVHGVLPAAWDPHGILAVPALGWRRAGNATAPAIVFNPVNFASSAGFVPDPAVVCDGARPMF
jgi:tRNA(Ile)-lysidine synthase